MMRIRFKNEDKNWDLSNDQKPRIEWYFNISDEEKRQIESSLEKESAESINETNLDVDAEKVEDLKGKEETENKIEDEPKNVNGGEKIVINKTIEEQHTDDYLDFNKENQIIYFREGINSPVKVLSGPLQIHKEKEKILLDMRPKVEDFFSPITTNLKDDITLNELIDPKYEFMQGIFHLAGLWGKQGYYIQTKSNNIKNIK